MAEKFHRQESRQNCHSMDMFSSPLSHLYFKSPLPPLTSFPALRYNFLFYLWFFLRLVCTYCSHSSCSKKNISIDVYQLLFDCINDFKLNSSGIIHYLKPSIYLKKLTYRKVTKVVKCIPILCTEIYQFLNFHHV